nr:hypothetical protein [Gordonia neofelifaecis]
MTAGALVTGLPAAEAAPPRDSGFAFPFAGAPAFVHLAPTEAGPGRLNQPLGLAAADAVAAGIGLGRGDVMSDRQYRAFVTGGGVGGSRAAAKEIDACVAILTNTVGRPLISRSDTGPTRSVLASYGVYVTTNGLLQSPANASAPTRKVNTLIAPGGYVGDWLRANGATRTLIALYRSAYTVEALYGFAAQQMSGAAQLVTNTANGTTSTVGMSMAPPLWLVNFALLYVMKPSLAAAMPAHWAPIPPAVARAIKASPTGQVPYSAYQRYFR